MPELLSMSEVSKGFWRGTHWMSVLEDVSLQVAAGEVAAVIGSREEGKTTLLKLAAGIENPDRGCVLIAGQDMAAMSGRTRERLLGEQIAWIDRERPGFSWRAWEYVALPLILSRRQDRHQAQQIALAALEGMNASPCAARRWSDLSNWERVLVGLARALASQPQMIILDDLLDGFSTLRIHEAGDRVKWMAEELSCGVLMSTSGIETTLLADSVWSFSHHHLTPLAGQAGSADAEVIDLFKASRPGTGTRDSG